MPESCGRVFKHIRRFSIDCVWMVQSIMPAYRPLPAERKSFGSDVESMRAKLKPQYDATRDFSNKKFRSACYAPFTSLYFDTFGKVRVCCHNVEYFVGDISRETIDAIWR